MPVVTDVLVSPLFFFGCDERSFVVRLWEIVEPQSFSFSRKNQAVGVENEEDMKNEGTPVKASPASRRKTVPPTPQQRVQPAMDAMWGTRKAAVVGWNTKANIGGRLVRERSSREWSST